VPSARPYHVNRRLFGAKAGDRRLFYIGRGGY
jgi:hypothetical protein